MFETFIVKQRKQTLDERNISYFFGAEILHEVGRPYLYHFNIYKEDIMLYVRQDTDKVYSTNWLPQELQVIVDTVNAYQDKQEANPEMYSEAR